MNYTPAPVSTSYRRLIYLPCWLGELDLRGALLYLDHIVVTLPLVQEELHRIIDAPSIILLPTVEDLIQHNV